MTRLLALKSIILNLLVLHAVCFLSLATANEGDKPNVSVTGTAVTCVTPDQILWSITTTDDNADLAKAKQASDESAARVMAIRDKLDIAPEKLTSGRLQINKIYDRDRGRNVSTFKHFRITRTYSIQQDDLDRFDEFLSEIVGGPVEGSFRYETSRRYELRNETRINAVKVARRKAQAMAVALGVDIGDPISIAETGGAYPSQTSNFAYNAVPGDADQQNGKMIPDAIEIKISVQVVFELKTTGEGK
ncbi:MAG: SIMPL domain-containing protein [Planctomycetota bacterium]|nr:SIMPL domain-containing protein [Planctomycetota bacterium]